MLSDSLGQNGAHGGGLHLDGSSTLYGESENHIGKRGSAIELHNAYIAAGTLAAAILIVVVVVSWVSGCIYCVGMWRARSNDFEVI